MERGYIQIYYGDGKGKTTAAGGLAVRAVGAGLTVCFAQFLKPGTSWETAIPFLPMVEVVLVMTVEPGFGGQSFLWKMVDKVEALHQYAEAHGLSYRIEVDGGINAETAPHVLRAGAELLVIGSYLFRQADPKSAMDAIRENARKLQRA